MAAPTLSMDQQKEIFLALVNAQDTGMSTSESRKSIRNQFGIDEATLRAIETIGVAGDWPPLDK
jgi:hypothetical protein